MKLNKYIDHTLLKQDATEEQINRLLSEAKDFDFARQSLSVERTWDYKGKAGSCLQKTSHLCGKYNSIGRQLSNFPN